MAKNFAILIIIVIILLIVLGGLFYLLKGDFPGFGLLGAFVGSLPQFNGKDVQTLELSLNETRSELEKLQKENYSLKEKLGLEEEIRIELEQKYEIEIIGLARKLESLTQMVNNFNQEITQLGVILGPKDKNDSEEKDEETTEESEEDVIEAVADVCPVNINTGSGEELQAITGIGPVLAQRIIGARPFSSIYDLIKVSGIGEATLQKIIDQACAYVEGDTGRPSSGVGGGGGAVSSIPTPTPVISPSFLSENPVNKDIGINLSISNLKSAAYDVKISILEVLEQSEQKRTLSEIYDGEKWQSSYNYLFEVFSGASFEGNFQLRIGQDKQDFRGEADIIVKIRDSEKGKIQAQWQGKIDITEPEPEPDVGAGSPSPEEEGEETSPLHEPEPEPEPEPGTTPPEVIFNLESVQTSLSFTLSWSGIDPIGNTTASGLDGFFLQYNIIETTSPIQDGISLWYQNENQEWQDWPVSEILELEEGKTNLLLLGEDEKAYYFQIKARDIAGNESDWVGASTKISLPKNLLKNEFFEEWEEPANSADYLYNWNYNGTKTHITRHGDGLMGNYSAKWAPITTSYNLTQNEIIITKDGSYYAEIWIKLLKVDGNNYIRVALDIADPIIGNFPTARFTDYKNEVDWVKLTRAIDNVKVGDSGGIRIRAQRLGSSGPYFLIGAAWLGATEPPENWPQ